MWRELTITSNRQNNPIGFFDSGVGGLTVLSAFRKILPQEDCIFFGDTKNMPYGEKTKDQLIEYSSRAFEFFEEQNVKAVIMACNTTSAVVYEDLKDKFDFKLYPLIQSVSRVFANLSVNRIGVFATAATINSHAYSKGINFYNNKIDVVEIACPEWVKLVENKAVNTPEALASVRLKMEEMLKHKPDKIVLGCTHYPYLLEQLSKFAPEKIFINPSEAYVNFIKNDLAKLGLLTTTKTPGYDKFYVSASPEKFINASKMFYDVNACEMFNCYCC